MIDPRKLRGAAALNEIVERLKTFGADVEKALDGAANKQEGFDIETPLGKMSGRMGVRVGPAMRPAAAPRKAARPATRAAEPLVDIHFDGEHLIVTTETDDPEAEVAVEGDRLSIRSARAPERVVTLPRRVKPETLSVSIVNGILEATMAPEDVA
jgi:HSP20 family molecular chaperone IbpA